VRWRQETEAVCSHKEFAVPITLLDDALGYLAIGWSVIPIGAEKKAACKWLPFQKERPAPETLKCLFEGPNITGVAVILGPVSGGLVCRDFDNRTAYDAWAVAHPELASSLPTVATARGMHVYFRWPGLASTKVLRDGEIRGRRVYCLLPPSLHPKGITYQWVNPLPDGELPLLDPFSAGLCDGMDQFTLATQQNKQLNQHIACVTSEALEAIDSTLPDRPGQRNRRVFDLARRLKAIPDLDSSPAMLKVIVSLWHQRALPVIRTKDFGETWSDFQIAWMNVKVPYGTALKTAFEAARRAPLAALDDNANLGVLAALCQRLSLAVQGKSFFLSCRTVAKLFNVYPMMALRWFKALQFHGLIAEVEKGCLKGHQATTWVWKGDSF
jgi:hypothetical protein